MLNFQFDIGQLFAVVQSIFAPMLPLILLIFGIVIGVYLIQYIPEIFALFFWVSEKIRGKPAIKKVLTEKEEKK